MVQKESLIGRCSDASEPAAWYRFEPAHSVSSKDENGMYVFPVGGGERYTNSVKPIWNFCKRNTLSFVFLDTKKLDLIA